MAKRPSKWKLPKKMWTDYPVPELGDKPNAPAPTRRCIVLAYDGDKYCEITVDGVPAFIKSGYLYHTRNGR